MIRVNDVAIEPEAVAREMQHHPAETREEAERQAATALIVRELLLQRATDREIAGADEDARIANLIALEVRVPEPSDDEIARYYRRNAIRFMTAPLYEAAHIFFPARGDDEDAIKDATARAEAVFRQLVEGQQSFAELAQTHSACSSKEHGGSLGQVSRNDTNVELERAMATMEVGATSIVRSRHGVHILRLDRRVRGEQMPLDRVSGWIADHLRKMSKRRAIAQYLQLLTAGAKIDGIDLAGADSPLVQ